MRHGGWKAFVPALALAIVLAGCSDGNHNGGGTSEQSPQVNYNEHDFALNPDLRANPDDILTLQLEDPSASEDELDTGEAAGVDVVPYTYLDTAERTFCWTVSDSEPVSAAPSHMRLINDATGDEVLRVEEGGDCVTQTVPAGRYSAVFNRTSASGDRDLVFIVPQIDAAQAATRAQEASEQAASDADAPAPGAEAPAAPCDFNNGKDVPSSFIPSALILRVVNPQTAAPCGVGSKFPFEPFFVGEGGCADLSLIRGGCTPNGMNYLAATLLAHQMRVYDDVFFRGPRKTVAREEFPDGNIDQILADLLKTFVIGDALYGIHGPGSVVMLRGGPPALNHVVLILTGGCDNCDLSGLSLDGVDLHGASLRRADLSHTSLQGANLSGIVASGVIFKSAYLAGADLRQADLETATFDSAGAVEGMNGQVYPAADLSDAKLDNAVLTTASLNGATLTNATFTHATLDFADLSRASAKGAIFKDASLMSAQLTDALLDNTAFDAARLDDANLQGATLINARLPGAHLEGAALQRDPTRGLRAANLKGAYLANANLTDADLTGVSMQDAQFYGAQAHAVGAHFDLAHLDGAVLSGANFTGASFHSATLDGAVCVNCSFNTAKLDGTDSALTEGASFVRADLRGADFTDAAVNECDFTGAAVSFNDITGTYRYGMSGNVIYSAPYRPSRMGRVTTDRSVICPSGARGPCDTREKLTAPAPTPTATTRPATPTATARVAATPTPAL